MKHQIFLFGLFAVAVLSSCNNAAPENNETVANSNDTLIVARSGYFDLTFSLPKTDTRLGMLEHGYDEEHGEYRIRMDEGFSIFITEETVNIQEMKSELANDMLFTYKIIEESPTVLHFQRILPDGTEQFHAYFEVRNLGGKDYFFRTEEMTDLSSGDIDLIKRTIATFAPGQKPA